MRRIRWFLLAALLLVGGCFPIELDVKDGKLLIAREEGFFVFDPAAGKLHKVIGAEDGKPVFARFSPDGRDVLTIFKSTSGFNEFRFLITPIGGGKGREVFKGENTAYVRYSPDGTQLAIVKMSEKDIPEFKNKMPEIHLVPVKGGPAKTVARTVGVLFRWFADSKRLLLFEIKKKDQSGNYLGNLAILDTSDGKLKPLATAAVSQQFFLDLAPDNKKALFTALRAGKPGTDQEKGKDYAMKLFEVDLASGELRAIDKQARYAIYSPDGKQVLLGTPPDGFNFDTLKLEVADAGLSKFTTVATDAHMPIALGGEGVVFPGWINDRTVFYFVNKAVYGTEGKAMQLVTVGSDGKTKKNLQAQIELEIQKEAK